MSVSSNLELYAGKRFADTVTLVLVYFVIFDFFMFYCFYIYLCITFKILKFDFLHSFHFFCGHSSQHSFYAKSIGAVSCIQYVIC